MTTGCTVSSDREIHQTRQSHYTTAFKLGVSRLDAQWVVIGRRDGNTESVFTAAVYGNVMRRLNSVIVPPPAPPVRYIRSKPVFKPHQAEFGFFSVGIPQSPAWCAVENGCHVLHCGRCRVVVMVRALWPGETPQTTFEHSNAALMLISALVWTIYNQVIKVVSNNKANFKPEFEGEDCFGLTQLSV